MDSPSEYSELYACEDNRQYDGELRSALIKETFKSFATNFQTNIHTHAYARLRQYFIKVKNKTPVETYNILKKLIDENIYPNDRIFQFCDKKLNFSDFNKNGTLWWKYLRLFRELQNHIDFTLSPIYDLGLKHVIYTVDGVHQLCRRVYKKSKDVEIPGSFKTATSGRNGNDEFAFRRMWCHFITVPKKLKKSFSYSVSTGGISVSLHCCREKREKKWYENPILNHDIEEYSRLVGLDPGLREIFGGIIIEAYGDYSNKNQQQRYKILNDTYHFMTHYFEREEKRERLTKSYKEIYEELLQGLNVERKFKLHNPSDYLRITKYRLELFEVSQL